MILNPSKQTNKRHLPDLCTNPRQQPLFELWKPKPRLRSLSGARGWLEAAPAAPFFRAVASPQGATRFSETPLSWESPPPPPGVQLSGANGVDRVNAGQAELLIIYL